MKTPFSRRNFLKRSAALSAVSMVNPSSAIADSLPDSPFEEYKPTHKIGKIALGNTGLEVSRLAFGSGTAGWKGTSNQVKIGNDTLQNMIQFAYDSGITFWDTADTYGSHRYFGEALKKIDRDKVTIMTKLWVRDNDWMQFEGVQKTIQRFRKELNTDYFDIVLMHCMVEKGWHKQYESVRDQLSEIKSKGIIKALGFSAHDYTAFAEGVEDDWSDVILARINNREKRMDHTPERIMKDLKKAKNKGKGIIGMKIFGSGELLSDNQRKESLEFVYGSGNIHTTTIGMESIPQIENNVRMINKILKA